MINHARTLLLNTNGALRVVSPDVPFDEIVDPTFKALALPGFIVAVRGVFFGANPDAAMLSWRTTQLLQVVQNGDAGDYITSLDPRITYDLTSYAMDRQAFIPVQTPAPRTIGQLAFGGSPNPPDSTGVMRRRFGVSTDGSSVTVTDLLTTFVATTSGLKAPLADCGYSVELFDVAPGDLWTVDLLLEPQISLGDLAATLKNMDGSALLNLFGSGLAEPYATFRNLWDEHPDFLMQLSGLILAVVWRSEEVRVGS